MIKLIEAPDLKQLADALNADKTIKRIVQIFGSSAFVEVPEPVDQNAPEVLISISKVNPDGSRELMESTKIVKDKDAVETVSKFDTEGKKIE